MQGKRVQSLGEWLRPHMLQGMTKRVFKKRKKSQRKWTCFHWEFDEWGDFPGSLVVRTRCFHCRGHKFSPWLGRPQTYPHTHTIPSHTHIPTNHAVWSTKQNKTRIVQQKKNWMNEMKCMNEHFLLAWFYVQLYAFANDEVLGSLGLMILILSVDPVIWLCNKPPQHMMT